MTIGDILAVIAAVLLAGASWGATLIMTSLLFPSAVGRAGEQMMSKPGACIGRGVGAVVVVAILGAMMNTAGPLRLVAGGLWCALVLTAAVGSAAIVRLMSERIGGLGSEMSPFARLTRAAALFVGAGFVPVAGWFLLTPIAAFAAVGAGLTGLRRPRPALMVTTPTAPVQPDVMQGTPHPL